MTTRIVLVLGALIFAVVALRRPAAPTAFAGGAAASPSASYARTPQRHHAARAAGSGAIVYVAGAVRHPGLYPMRGDERADDAIRRAGGLLSVADDGAVNLAAHALEGDEIYVPRIGEPARGRIRTSSAKRGTRLRGRSGADPASAGVDVNAADEAALARVPGIGPAIAARIVELRALEGPFASLDELLDVAGMTQARLDRARSHLRPP